MSIRKSTIYDLARMAEVSASTVSAVLSGSWQARRIADWLDARREAEMIVVSLSKGTAEVKLALKHHPEAFRHVYAWINISGLLYGSEWVRWLLDRPISRCSARVW